MAPAALVSGTFAYIGVTFAVAVLGFLFGKARSVSRDNLEYVRARRATRLSRSPPDGPLLRAPAGARESCAQRPD